MACTRLPGRASTSVCAILLAYVMLWTGASLAGQDHGSPMALSAYARKRWPDIWAMVASDRRPEPPVPHRPAAGGIGPEAGIGLGQSPAVTEATVPAPRHGNAAVRPVSSWQSSQSRLKLPTSATECQTLGDPEFEGDCPLRIINPSFALQPQLAAANRSDDRAPVDWSKDPIAHHLQLESQRSGVAGRVEGADGRFPTDRQH